MALLSRPCPRPAVIGRRKAHPAAPRSTTLVLSSYRDSRARVSGNPGRELLLGVRWAAALLHEFVSPEVDALPGLRTSPSEFTREGFCLPDEATKELMIDFYRRIWIEKKPKAQALWNAKMALRAKGAPTGDWAAWVLTGDPD